jgi:hypothetical protein
VYFSPYSTVFYVSTSTVAYFILYCHIFMFYCLCCALCCLTDESIKIFASYTRLCGEAVNDNAFLEFLRILARGEVMGIWMKHVLLTSRSEKRTRR